MPWKSESTLSISLKSGILVRALAVKVAFVAVPCPDAPARLNVPIDGRGAPEAGVVPGAAVELVKLKAGVNAPTARPGAALVDVVDVLAGVALVA